MEERVDPYIQSPLQSYEGPALLTKTRVRESRVGPEMSVLLNIANVFFRLPLGP